MRDRLSRDDMTFSNGIFGVVIYKRPNEYPKGVHGWQTLVDFYIEDDEIFSYRYTVDSHWVEDICDLMITVLASDWVKYK